MFYIRCRVPQGQTLRPWHTAFLCLWSYAIGVPSRSFCILLPRFLHKSCIPCIYLQNHGQTRAYMIMYMNMYMKMIMIMSMIMRVGERKNKARPRASEASGGG